MRHSAPASGRGAVAAFLLLCWIAVPCAPGSPVADLAAQTVDRQRMAAAVDSIAEAALREGPIAGLSIAVVRGADTLVMRGYGFADLEHGVPASAHTVHRIGSITKQFTAAAILQLADEGQLDLDDDLTRFLPDYPTNGRRITVAQLLNHTSGIRSYTGLPAWRRFQRMATAHEDLVAIFSDEPYDFEPGTEYRYNNSGYYLLGLIIEAVSGLDYASYLEERISAPLGLEATYYCDTEPIIPHRSAGYVIVRGELRNAGFVDMGNPYAAGAMCATVGDLVRWKRALVSGRVFSPDRWTEMTSPTRLADGRSVSYGFGLSVADALGRTRVSHGGAINGFNAFLSYYPDEDLIVAVLANTGGAGAARIERTIAATVLESRTLTP